MNTLFKKADKKTLIELVKVIKKYNIKNFNYFIAQCAHESNGFTTFVENLNYSAEGLVKTFPKYFPTLESAQSYARQPEKIANKVYANRMGNGPENSGDGWKFRGKGIIQLTGKNNHEKFAKDFNLSIDEAIDYLLTIEGAIESAAWFWMKNNLDDINDYTKLTIKINGGVNWLVERKILLKKVIDLKLNLY